MSSLLVSNYLHLLNAGEKLEVKLFNIIRIFGFSCCLFLFHLCRASLCVCEWDIEYMSLNAIPSKCVYTSPYCVPFHMFYQFQVYRHLLCICRVIQVQSTIFLIRRKCRTRTHTHTWNLHAQMFKANGIRTYCHDYCCTKEKRIHKQFLYSGIE